ncbi:MAG: glycoside hydrolase family 65 protein [Bacteroidales bacterium]
MKRIALISFLWGILSTILFAQSSKDWVVIAEESDVFFPACAANGEVGIGIGKQPLSFGPVILGGAYEKGSSRDVSRILEGINPFGLTMRVNGEVLDSASLTLGMMAIDMKHAVHTTTFNTKGITIIQRMRALRNMPYAFLLEIEVSSENDAEIMFTNQHRHPSHISNFRTEQNIIPCDDLHRAVQRSTGNYSDDRETISTTSIYLCKEGVEQLDAASVKIGVKQGDSRSFALIGVVCTTEQFSDPWNESDRQAIYAVLEGKNRLISAHERRWADLWKGDIVIEGDIQAQQDVRFALYNLYSSIREGSRRSIPPMGLTARGYNGHIFWDSEIWMYPALLVLQPDLARQMLDYRIGHLEKSKQRAFAYGYKGAMYPWESDKWGEESTPTYALSGPQEHHVTADIAIACWNYYCVTGDIDWLRTEGFPVMRETAAFWCDRVEANTDGSFSICNVVGANEYATGVNDNAFTNGSVRRALEYTLAAAKLCGQKEDSQWLSIANGLRIPKFEDGITREHASYDGRMIKQADANLLGYPLGLISSPNSILKDLAYYENRIDPKNGPAMSYSVFSIQYARLGMIEKACELFKKAYEPNLRPPFRVFAETSTSINPYFMTGAGGMLQAVLFGFGGLHITEQGLIQKEFVLPPNWKGLIIKTPGHTYSCPKTEVYIDGI